MSLRQLAASTAAMTRGDRFLVGSLVAFFVVFGVFVEIRGALLSRPMTDAGCFFRGAWAVRTGHDMYDVMDDNGWHYNYPPLTAIAFTPLADAPFGQPRDGLLPYAWSVGLWYALSVLLYVAAVQMLASALEATSADPEVRATQLWSHAWWRRRLVPALVCLPPAAHTLMRGQVNFILLFSMVAGISLAMRGRRLLAGLALAVGPAIKLYPAFLFVAPLWRRDWRMLVGGAVGAAITFGLVPAVVLGPARTVACYQKLFAVVIQPGLTHTGDNSRAKELTDVTATGSQALGPVLHNLLHPQRETRPAHVATWLKLAALALVGAFTLAVLLKAGRQQAWHDQKSGADTLIAWGLLIVAMLMASPISHMHYFCYCLPLVMGLNEKLDGNRAWQALGWIWIVACVLPHFPELTQLRDFGLLTGATLLVCGVGLAHLGRDADRQEERPGAEPAAEPLKVAA